MGLIRTIFGWRKLIEFTVTLGDRSSIAVSCREYIAPIPSNEYVRLWLEFVAHAWVVFKAHGPDCYKSFCHTLLALGEATSNSHTDVFSIPGLNAVLANQVGDQCTHFVPVVQGPTDTVSGTYYVKGSSFRYVEMAVNSRPELLISALLAMFQYAINRNRDDKLATRVLGRSACISAELYTASFGAGVRAIVQFPLLAYMRANAEVYADEIKRNPSFVTDLARKSPSDEAEQ